MILFHCREFGQYIFEGSETAAGFIIAFVNVAGYAMHTRHPHFFICYVFVKKGIQFLLFPIIQFFMLFCHLYGL